MLQGVPVPIVARLLNHRNAATTLRYAHVRNSDVESAAERIGATIRYGYRRIHVLLRREG